MFARFDTKVAHQAPGLPLVVAHRGASRFAPENSVAATRIAIAQGADMIEIDIRRTADGVLIAHHDALLDGSPLRELSYEVVRQSRPEIATLHELLDAAAGRVLLDVELKEEGYGGEALAMLAERFRLEDLIVTSFSSRTVRRVRQLAPSLRTGWIVGAPPKVDLLPRFQRTGADWLVVEAACLTSDLVADLQKGKVRVAVWTVNLWSDLHHMLRLPGLAAVITDLPDVARAVRRRHAAEPVVAIRSLSADARSRASIRAAPG